MTLNLKDENVRPKFIKARTVPMAFREKVDKELDRLTEIGIISQTEHSDWATPLVPVIKPDGSVRLCADYKVTLNADLEDVVYPLPLVEELFSALQGGAKFSKLDLKEAYTQVEVDDRTKQLLTWNTQKGLFKVNRMVYGTKPNTAIFQQIMEKTLKGVESTVVLVDDILVTGKDNEQHLQNLKSVFERLQQAGFKLKKEKCVFLQPNVKYLGHIIDERGLHKDPEKVGAMLEAPRPGDQTQLRSFIGMINYYARFVPNLSSILSPLFSLLKKESKFAWTEACEEAFLEAKKRMTSNEILAHAAF